MASLHGILTRNMVVSLTIVSGGVYVTAGGRQEEKGSGYDVCT